jgi:hypothetical protein
MGILKVGKVIYALLKDTASVFPMVADEGTKFPFIIYKRTGTQIGDTKDIYNYSETAYIEVILATEDYETSISLAEEIKTKLEHFRGQIEGITVTCIKMTDAAEDFAGDCYTQRLNFSVEISK